MLNPSSNGQRIINIYLYWIYQPLLDNKFNPISSICKTLLRLRLYTENFALSVNEYFNFSSSKQQHHLMVEGWIPSQNMPSFTLLSPLFNFPSHAMDKNVIYQTNLQLCLQTHLILTESQKPMLPEWGQTDKWSQRVWGDKQC